VHLSQIRAALSWIRRVSLPINALQEDKTVRQVFDILALKLDGTAASFTISSNTWSVRIA